MKAAFAVLALGLICSASAIFSEGTFSWEKDFLLLNRANVVDFDDDHKKFVLHFNTCEKYDIIIDQVAVLQARGHATSIKKIKGGSGEKSVIIEMTGGNGITNFQVRVWGTYNGQPVQIDHEESFMVNSKETPCTN